MKLVLTTISISLFLGACSFSKHSNSNSAEQSTKIIQLSNKNDMPTLEELFTKSSRTTLLNFVSKSSISKLSQMKDQDGNGLFDFVAKYFDFELASILQGKGYSPFIFNNPKSLLFLKAYQEKELEIFYSLLDGESLELKQIQSKNYPTTVCKEIFQRLLEKRWSSSDSSPKLEGLILKVLISGECKPILLSIEDKDKNKLMSLEYAYQYKNDFPELTLISSLLFGLEIKDKSIVGSDPRILFNRKKDCLSPSQQRSWTKFIDISLSNEGPYSLRLIDCPDVPGIRELNMGAGSCLLEDTIAYIDSANSSVNSEINERLSLSEEVTCKK